MTTSTAPTMPRVIRIWGRTANAIARETPAARPPQRPSKCRTRKSVSSISDVENQISDENSPEYVMCGCHSATSNPRQRHREPRRNEPRRDQRRTRRGDGARERVHEADGQRIVPSEDGELDGHEVVRAPRPHEQDPRLARGGAGEQALGPRHVPAHVRVDRGERRLHAERPVGADGERHEERHHGNEPASPDGNERPEEASSHATASITRVR